MRASVAVSMMSPVGQAGGPPTSAALAAQPDPVAVPHRVVGLVGRAPGA